MSAAAKVDLAALAKRDAFCVGLGIELVEASRGRAVTRVTVGAQHLNFHGACHGGLTFTLADAAFGFACNSRGVAAFGIDIAHDLQSPGEGRRGADRDRGRDLALQQARRIIVST